MWNRCVQGPGAAGPEGGADSETGRGSSSMQGVEGRGAVLPWQQQQQQRAGAVGDRRQEVWSGLGSSVERDESEEEKHRQTNCNQGFFLSLKKKLRI